MKASEVYKKYVILSEENATNDNVSVSRDRFVERINEAFQRFVEYIYEKKNEDDLRYIQTLLVPDKKITRTSKVKNTEMFKLPEDYFEFSNVWGEGSKGDCKNQSFDLYEIKNMNLNMVLNDEFLSPSFKYREAPFNLAKDSVVIYTNGFDIDRIYLSYYRYPKAVKLTVPSDPESQLDDSYDLDFDEKAINRIVWLAVRGTDIATSNERFQIDSAIAQSKL